MLMIMFAVQVLTWAKQHEQRLETALAELLSNASLLEELLSWLQWADTTLVQRDTEPLPQDIPQLKTLITEHQVSETQSSVHVLSLSLAILIALFIAEMFLSIFVFFYQLFMEEMTRKQPDVDKVTKTYKRKPAEHPSSLSDRRGARKKRYPQLHACCIQTQIFT